MRLLNGIGWLLVGSSDRLLWCGNKHSFT